jgi:hypothetical protein
MYCTDRYLLFFYNLKNYASFVYCSVLLKEAGTGADLKELNKTDNNVQLFLPVYSMWTRSVISNDL